LELDFGLLKESSSTAGSEVTAKKKDLSKG